LTPDKV